MPGETTPEQDPSGPTTSNAGSTTGTGAATVTGTSDPKTDTDDPTGSAEATTVATTTGEPNSTGSDGDDDGTTDAPAPEFIPCETLPFCPADAATCPLSAQTNASVTGDTPLGPFAASFAAVSLPNAYGSVSEVVLVPAYKEEDLCAGTSRMVLIVPHPCWDVEPEVTVPAELTIDGQTTTTTASLHNFTCNWWAFWCDGCEGHLAFDLEISDAGWSLAGSVDAGCCRSFHHENSL